MMKTCIRLVISIFFCTIVLYCSEKEASIKSRKILVLMSDFGLSERFVASMKGVALSVDENLKIHDLTHLIEPFNIWEATQTLAGTIKYWPEGTVFVSVVDPGVGTERKSVVLKTRSGHFIVTPDNGTLTLVAELYGIAEVREIDEEVNRLKDSSASHTFHGRDVYAYTGARLASGVITFEKVGPRLKPEVVRLPYQPAKKISDSVILGNITKVEKPFGNITTNIPLELFKEFGLNPGQEALVKIEITNKDRTIYEESIPYVLSFGHVGENKPLLYADSVQMMGLALNGGDFSVSYGVKAGPDWAIRITKLKN